MAGLPPARSPPHAVLPRTVPQMLDLKNIQVISQVLAQSVAMDFYSRWVGRKARRGGKRGGEESAAGRKARRGPPGVCARWVRVC